MNKKHIQTMIFSLKIALKETSKKFNKTKNHIIINRTKSV